LNVASLTFAFAFGAGVAAQLAARTLRMPAIVLLLAFGVLLGPDIGGFIDPAALGAGLHAIVRLAVAVILFEGALNLDLARLAREQSAIRALVTVGAAVTATGGTLAARWLMGFEWDLALLFGTLVIVTGPTVVKPILRNVPLRPRLATVLEAEGVLIDPVGAIVAAVTLQLVTGAEGTSGLASGLREFAERVGFGAGAGALAGFVLGRLLRPRRFVPEGLENLVSLGAVLALHEACELAMPESGILAVTVAGVVVGNTSGARVGRDLREFQEPLSVGLIGVLFVLLAADVRIADVAALGAPGLLVVAALVFVVRPCNILVSTLRADLGWREKLFLAWVAPRGVVAAAVASIFASHLVVFGMEGASALRALVFLTIGVTVVLQGGSAPLVARWLGVRAPPRDGVAILGAEELGFAFGEILRGAGSERRVAFIDTNPAHCRAAEERGFAVVMGNALEARTLARARLEQVRAAVGLTANDQVNSLFAREARDEFGVPETYVAVTRTRSKVTDELLERQDSRVLFDRPKDVERWHVRLRHGLVEIRQFRYAPPSPSPPQQTPKSAGPDAVGSADPYVILAVRRSGEWMPMHTRFEPRAEDVAAAAIHRAEEAAALEALASLGWQPA
jgi:NhaP-type Na+/H+ or K+/H+ antiporter